MNTEHKIIISDSRTMDSIENNSIQLVVTSPPYWQLKDYGNNDQIGFNQSYPEYIRSLNSVWAECYRVLEPECRLCINIGDQFTRTDIYGRYKIIPIREEIIRFCESIGFDYMGAIIWQKVTTCNTSGGASIMGSYPYPRNGILKLDYEFILTFKKLGKSKRKIERDIKKQSEISKEDWKEWFNGHWYFPGEKQSGHIAMFPLELPKRLICMFTFQGETVMDPFAGSGSTAAAALLSGRNSVGYEIDECLKDVIKNKFNSHLDLTNINTTKLIYEHQDYTEPSVSEMEKDLLSSLDELVNSHSMDTGILEHISNQANIFRKMDDTLKKYAAENLLDSIHRNITGLLNTRSKKNMEILYNILYRINNLKALYYNVNENVRRISSNYKDYKSVISRGNKDAKQSAFVKIKGMLDVNRLVTESGDTIVLSGVRPLDSETINRQAAEYIKKSVINKKVEIEQSEDGTVLIRLRDKTNINAKLIKEGYADVDEVTSGRFKDRFLSYKAEAKNVGKGYWEFI